MGSHRSVSRRGFLTTVAGTAATAAAAGTATAQASFDGWMSDVGNYDEVTDATGQDEVSVTVGAEANGGNFGFGPAAVQVDPGATVVWEWNGEGGQHNVVDEGGNFESDLSAEAGFTFEQTFEEEGVIKYFCQPHRALGMKGVVVVGSMPDSGGDGGGGGGGGGGEGGGEVDLHTLGVPIQAHWVGAATILGIILSLIFSFYVLKYGESPHTGTGRGE